MPTLTVDQTLDVARKHYRAGRFRQAEGICRQILSQYPNHTETLVSLGTLMLEAGRLEESIALFRQVVRWNPNNLGAYLTLGSPLQVRGALSEAAHVYHRVLKLFPASDEVFTGWGTLSAHGNLGQRSTDRPAR